MLMGSYEFPELKEDSRLLNKLGLHLVADEELTPSQFVEDPLNCPYFATGECESAKDPEYKERCSGPNFNYKNCRIYQLSQKTDFQKPTVAISNSMEDTVIMKPSEVVRKRYHDASLQDQINDDSDSGIHKLVAESPEAYRENRRRKTRRWEQHKRDRKHRTSI